MKTLKNGPQKLLIIGQNLFFSQSSPANSPQPKIDFFHIINMSQDASVSLSVLSPYRLYMQIVEFSTTLPDLFLFLSQSSTRSIQ